jgi:hypothetical protein
LQIEIGIRHEMEKNDLHGVTSLPGI